MQRGTACLYALQHRVPLVVQGEAKAADVVAFLDGLLQAEVVMERPPEAVRVCGGPDDWRRWQAEQAAETTPKVQAVLWGNQATPIQRAMLRERLSAAGGQQVAPHIFEGP
jgi:hypothetical protein